MKLFYYEEKSLLIEGKSFSSFFLEKHIDDYYKEV